MKTSLLILSIVLYISTFSQDSCVVKVCLSDCLNCYVGMKYVENSSDNIKKTIVFPEISQTDINAYLTRVLHITDVSQFKVVVSDSIYNSINKSHTSEVYVYDKNKQYNHSSLKTFYGFKDSGPFEIQIPDTIAVSVSATISNDENYFFITDYTFGQFVFVRKHGNHEVFVVSGQDLTNKTIFNSITGDTISYHMFSKYKEELKNAGMDRMRVEPSFGTGNEIGAYLMAPDIQAENGGLGLTYKTGIIVFNHPNDYKILRIDDESIPENYYASSGSFSRYMGNYYLQLINIDETQDDQYVFGKFILTDEELEFTGFNEYKLPSEYLPVSKLHSMRKIVTFVNPYVFLQYSLSYFDMANDQTYTLPLDPANLDVNFNQMNINLTKIESDYHFADAFVTEKTIQVLYKTTNTYYIALIDRDDHALISKTEIANPSSKLKAGMSFYSADKLYYLTNNNTIIVEEINYR